MDILTWYYAGKKSTYIDLPFTNSSGVSMAFSTNIGNTINVDFGDGIIQSVPTDSNYVDYSFGNNISGRVRIYNANRLLRIRCGTVYLTNWNFSLSTLLICRNLDTFQVRSGNVYGNIANISRVLTWFSIIAGNGIVTGTVDDIPDDIGTFDCRSSNSNVQVDIPTLTEQKSHLTAFLVSGQSKCVGDIHDIPSGVTAFSLRNIGARLHEVTYSGGRTWASNMTTVYVAPATGWGLTTTQIDNLLIDLSNTTWLNNGYSVINLSIGNSPRSSLSDTAVASLTAAGVSVTTA